MKFFLILIVFLTMILSETTSAYEIDFNFNDIEEPKVVMMDDILLNDLLKLQSKIMIEQTRMIAGEFEAKKKKEKKSHLDSLRSKLNGQGGYTRL